MYTLVVFRTDTPAVLSIDGYQFQSNLLYAFSSTSLLPRPPKELEELGLTIGHAETAPPEAVLDWQMTSRGTSGDRKYESRGG